MPRTGPRRVQVATRVLAEDVDEIDEIVEASGVGRSDVVRASIELALHGVERDAFTAWVTERGKETSAPLEQAWRDRLVAPPRPA